MPGPLDSIYRIRDCHSKRASSYDRTGGNADYITIPPRSEAVLANLSGAGIIRHIWLTVNSADPLYRRNLVLRLYWNGCARPSVECPLGDFFGQGFGQSYNFVSLPLAAAPLDGRALNSYFPMPFAGGAVVSIENPTDIPLDNLFYCIDYEEHADLPDDAAYFHAFWNREITSPRDAQSENEWEMFGPSAANPGVGNNYLIADISGRGAFVGVNYYVDCPTPVWYGEGDDMWLVDGEPWPGSLHGTGTEDFFNSAWCPRERYAHPYFGYAMVNEKIGWMGWTHCYRFFLEDPVHFTRSLHLSIEHGHANCLTLDLCTVAYWYQTEPVGPLRPLPPVEARRNMPNVSIHEIHRWRDAWRREMGGGTLWGHEEKKEADR